MNDTPILSDEVRKRKDAPKDVDPYDISEAETALNEAAKRVNVVWISFISLCVYIFIATFTVNPAMLFRDAPVKMPIFDAPLPLRVYFVMAPFLILAFHAYLIVLTKGLGEKIDAYECALKRSVKIASDKRALRARLDNSIILRALGSKHTSAWGGVDYASIFVWLLSMLIMPVALLLLTQLVFLPYQDNWMTKGHRLFIIVDFVLCVWLVWPFRSPWPVLAARLAAIAFAFFAATISVFFAAFPGEWIYQKLNADGPNFLTVALFEGPPDPVDYNHNGGVSPFSNRLILHDDKKLAETASASSGSVSFSVRGRNFRNAVFDRSNLARVDFSASHLEGASLRGAMLEGAKFECAQPAFRAWRDDRPGVDDALSFTPGGDHDCANLDGATLRYATLDRASFKGAHLNDADFQTASLNSAAFDHAEMKGADLEKATVENADFSDALLLGANFHGAHGRAVNFYNAHLTAADFNFARLPFANFNRAKLQGASLSSANLVAADFNDARMEGVDASRAILTAARFEGAYLHDAILDNSYIKGAFFGSASLERASLKCVTPFRSIFVGDYEVRDADLALTVVSDPSIECPGGCGNHKSPSYNRDIYHKGYRYSLSRDHVPSRSSRFSGYYYGAYGSVRLPQGDDWDAPECYLFYDRNIYTSPEKLDEISFEDKLSKLLSYIPNEEAKKRVRLAFERLKRGALTDKQDRSEKAFWSEWAKNTAPQEIHDKALAARLEVMACVADGAPYVAMGLTLAGRFDQMYGDKEMNKVKIRIGERIRKASDGGDSSCLGAKGLIKALGKKGYKIERYFPEPAP